MCARKVCSRWSSSWEVGRAVEGLVDSVGLVDNVMPPLLQNRCWSTIERGDWCCWEGTREGGSLSRSTAHLQGAAMQLHQRTGDGWPQHASHRQRRWLIGSVKEGSIKSGQVFSGKFPAA